MSWNHYLASPEASTSLLGAPGVEKFIGRLPGAFWGERLIGFSLQGAAGGGRQPTGLRPAARFPALLPLASSSPARRRRSAWARSARLSLFPRLLLPD